MPCNNRPGRRRKRNLTNFDEVVQAIRNQDSFGPREIRTVEFSTLSFQKQVKVAYSTDVLVMVHGGALVHATWLPYGAMIFDIYPYGLLSLKIQATQRRIRITLLTLQQLQRK